MTVSVILSTYNAVEWLEKVLYGFSVQTYTDFEIVVADDGSRDETAKLIEKFRRESHLQLVHVWHQDDGFRKTKILNAAILNAKADYLIFTDGDCIPRADFIQVHLDNRKPNTFLSGGYHKLTMDVSHKIQPDDILSQRAFNKNWLIENGHPKPVNLKIGAPRFLRPILNTLTPTKPTWNGHNASGWKADLMRANGFDERMKYGGEDRELGERLTFAGIKGKQIRYSAICIHLDHARGYVSEEVWKVNDAIRLETEKNRLQRTNFGIDSTTRDEILK